MDASKKAREFASFVRSTDEFKLMNKYKLEIDKNKSLKRQLDSYINKKNNIYSSYRMEDASRKINQLNNDYSTFFEIPVISNYMQATKEFNTMMEQLYKIIEKELIK